MNKEQFLANLHLEAFFQQFLQQEVSPAVLLEAVSREAKIAQVNEQIYWDDINFFLFMIALDYLLVERGENTWFVERAYTEEESACVNTRFAIQNMEEVLWILEINTDKIAVQTLWEDALKKVRQCPALTQGLSEEHALVIVLKQGLLPIAESFNTKTLENIEELRKALKKTLIVISLQIKTH